VSSIVETLLSSPVGTLRLVATSHALVGVYFEQHRRAPELFSRIDPEAAKQHSVLVQATRELTEYFAGSRRRFTVPLAPEGTEFQQAVWMGLREIPYGKIISYAELGHALGRSKASRAVGSANARNPLSIVVPCHRVIGASGKLTGYAGGVETKSWLLAHEQTHCGQTHP
jgi:methylated-DNA-[protein]-cysteine S-methyltransferase